MSDRIWNFPTLQVSKQLFHVPGAAIEGGFTTGGARIMSPEPGGRSVLEMQISLQVNEWDYPMSSWLMSKINGQVFRVRLAPTPQVLSARSLGIPWDNNGPWDNDENWAGDLTGVYASVALEGSNIVTIDMSGYDNALRLGHVIGHGNNCYMVDDISYSESIATITVTPPLRKNVAIGDSVYFRPFFLGTISNGDAFRVTYDAENVGAIQPGSITFTEAVV